MSELPVDADSCAALAAAAAAGPFFGLEPWVPGAGWRPLRELVQDPAVLRERVADARAVIATMAGLDPVAVEERVAASVLFLGLAAGPLVFGPIVQSYGYAAGFTACASVSMALALVMAGLHAEPLRRRSEVPLPPPAPGT